jgi:hypothetical protein
MPLRKRDIRLIFCGEYGISRMGSLKQYDHIVSSGKIE